MNEVEDFNAKNPDMGESFQQFSSQYQTLAEVWQNCPRSDWMLWILYKRKHRNFRKVEKYVDWLRERVQQYDNPEVVRLWLADFDAYKVFSHEQIERDLEEDKINHGDARWLHFIG